MTSTLAPFPHPETGEMLEAQEDFIRALEEITNRMAPLWRLQRAIQRAYADRFEPILPRRVYRTDKQERVSRCPRCGRAEEQ